MPPGVVQLVSARANDALGEVDVPVSISNAPNSMVVVNLAYDVAKKGGDDITEANSTVNEFAKQTAEINGTTQAVEKLRIVDALCKVDPTTGVDVYSARTHYRKGKGARLQVTARDANGAATSCNVRAIKLTPLGKLHYLSSGHSALAVELREYMAKCVKRLHDLKQECLTYVSTHEEETGTAKQVRGETIRILQEKGMDLPDAMGIALSVDKEVSFPVLLGTVRNGGVHSGEPGVKSATAAIKTVAAMPGAVTQVSKRSKSEALNLTGRIEQAFVRNKVRLAFQREPGTISKPRARAILRQTAHRNKDAMLEYENNDDDELLSAHEQARAKFDSAQDMATGVAPAPAPPATPMWLAQRGLA